MIKYTKTTEGIVTLTLDMRNSLVNIINHNLGKVFLPIINQLQKEKKEGVIKGIVITSAKDTFLVGGNLEYLYNATDPKEIFHFVEQLNSVLRAIEQPGIPVVAAINGTAIGSGFELALACHRRIVLDDANIGLGLPEVNLGIIPSSGGVVRLLWLLGIKKAVSTLTEGKIFNPQQALELGMIDELASNRKEMIQQAYQWIRDNPSASQEWDKPNGRIKKGTLKTWHNANYIRAAIAKLVSRTHNNCPAEEAILSTIVESTSVDFDTANRISNRYFTELAIGKHAKNRIKLFWFDVNKMKSACSRPKGFGRFRPRKIGIVGAGVMGSSIAYSCAISGIDVTIKDVSKAIANRGLSLINELIITDIEDGKKVEKEQILGRIKTTDSFNDFEECDLVIEAVFENKNVKNKVTRESEKVMDKYAFIASNTSTLSISSLSKAALHPENYIGLHFFTPVHTSQIVEIIYGEKTSQETIARSFDFVQKLKKFPIIVKDSKGFFVGRIQAVYVLEAVLMLIEGQTPSTIERGALKAGMGLAPLALADKHGLEYIVNTGSRHEAHKPSIEMIHTFTRTLNRRGKYQKSGFYNYSDNAPPRLWEELKEHLPHTTNQLNITEIIERLMFIQVVESARCLEEGILLSERTANISSVFGWDFAPFEGGVIQYVRNYGKDKFIKRCSKLADIYGDRYTVPKYIKDLEEDDLFGANN